MLTLLYGGAVVLGLGLEQRRGVRVLVERDSQINPQGEGRHPDNWYVPLS
jgi:hypothetical protein